MTQSIAVPRASCLHYGILTDENVANFLRSCAADVGLAEVLFATFPGQEDNRGVELISSLDAEASRRLASALPTAGGIERFQPSLAGSAITNPLE